MKLHIYMYLLIMDWWSRAGRRRYHVVKQAKYILVNSFLHTYINVCVCLASVPCARTMHNVLRTAAAVCIPGTF